MSADKTLGSVVFSLNIMDWIHAVLFLALDAFYVEPIILSERICTGDGSLQCGRHCQKHDSQSAPNGPSHHHQTSTRIHSRQ